MRGNSSTETVAAKAHHIIVGQTIQGGFLDGVKLEFVDGLNCIIGGRGTGKTTVLEFMRYVLGLMPDQRLNAARARAVGNQVQSNLGSGAVRLDVRTKHGVRYGAERSWNNPPQIFSEAGEAMPISFDRDLIFKADVYSQNEIEEIATNTRYQLALIDKFVDEDMRELDTRHRKLVRDLEENAAELLRLGQEARDLRETAAEAPALDEKLKALAETADPNAQHINDAHRRRALREKERHALEALSEDVEGARDEFESLASKWSRKLDSRLDSDLATGPNADLFEPVATHVQEIVRLLGRAASKISEQANGVEECIAEQGTMLADRHAKQEAEYRALVTKTKEEAGRAAERTQVQQRHAEAAEAKKELAAAEKELQKLAKQRRELTGALSSLRDQRFQGRKGVADRLTAALEPHIRVSVTQGGDRDGYQALLTEALRESATKFGAIVDKIVATLSPEELAAIVQSKDVDRLSERAGLTFERAKRVVDHLCNTPIIYKLETVDLDDLPRIELLDGTEYKDSGGLSTGQRCTTVLPILLLENERPLLIDQPEDNLDNKFIYETVVRSVKSAKGRRQLIFVTHNPNIPVLGDAERVFVLESDGKRARLAGQGTVDEMKAQVETLLEGGREAFTMRMQRYGH